MDRRTKSLKSVFTLLAVGCCNFCLIHKIMAQGGGTITGKVVDATTGIALPKVEIRSEPIPGDPASVSPRSHASSQTDADGIFSLKGLPPGKYFVIVMANGYLSENLGADTSSDAQSSIHVVPGGESTLDVKLKRLSRVCGQIADSLGRPETGSRIQMLTLTSFGNEKRLSAAEAAQSSKKGKYCFEDVYPGQYYMKAIPSEDTSPLSKSRQEGTSNTSVATRPVPTFYPSTSLASAATVVQVRAGEDLSDITIVLQDAPVYRIQGSIKDPTRAKLQHSKISIFNRSDIQETSPLLETEASTDGRFEFPSLPSATYRLCLFGSDQNGNKTLSGTSDVELYDHDASGIVISPVTARSLRGNISLEGPEKTSLSTVVLSLLSNLAQVTQDPEIQADGSFSFIGLWPDEFVLTIRGIPKGFYVKACTLGNQDLSESTIDLSSASADHLAIVLSSGAGEVNAALRSRPSEGPPESELVLVPAHPSGGIIVLDSNAYNIGSHMVRKNVAPGLYTAYAVSRFAETELGTAVWEDPTFLTYIQNEGIRCDVHEGERLNVEVSLLESRIIKQALIEAGRN